MPQGCEADQLRIYVDGLVSHWQWMQCKARHHLLFDLVLAVMEEMEHSNAGLMRRIVQLEREKDELHRDIELLCMQQSGFSGTVDINSHMQARRAAGFEQELDACKQKLALHTKINLGLQDELAESYRTKVEIADALKATIDKNKGLEKEVKFYQTRMAGAFMERDKALLKVDELHAAEESMIKELQVLHDRLEKTRAQCCEVEECYSEVQERMDVSSLELKRVQQVVEKFWKLCNLPLENGVIHEELANKVQVLLEDNDANFTYGLLAGDLRGDSGSTLPLSLDQAQEEFAVSKTTASKLEELFFIKSVSTKVEEELISRKLASTELQEELEQARKTSIELRRQLDDECLARKDAEEKILAMLPLKLKKNTIEMDLQELRNQHTSLKTMVSASFEMVKIDISVMAESLQHTLETVKSEGHKHEKLLLEEEKDDPVVVEVTHKQKPLQVFREGEGQCLTPEEGQEGRFHNIPCTDDSRNILAQALQEKVEALLLLSQQEERYYLEASTLSALEAKVVVLNQKLAQVTGEKVKALMDLAEDNQEIQVLQERQREITQWLEEQNITYPVGWSETRASMSSQALEDKVVVKTKLLFMPRGGYLKGWLKGLDMSGSKSPSSDASSNNSTPTVTSSSKSQSGNSIPRLLIENAALQERLARLQHVTKSAHKLRMTLVKVATKSRGELEPPLIQSAIAIVESVKVEAKQLITALPGCSLPVSFQWPLENSPGNLSVDHSPGEILEGDVGQPQDSAHHDSVRWAGMEMAESLVMTAGLLTESCRARLNFASSAQ